MDSRDFQGAVDAGSQQSFSDRLSELADERPNAGAFFHVNRHTERVLTWREVADEANAVSSGLRASGLADGSRVAVIASTSFGFITALFGILRAGATAVTLPTPSSVAKSHIARGRNERMLAAVGAHAFVQVAESELECDEAALRAADVRYLHLSELKRLTSTAAVASPTDLDRIAILQPTSGTTAEPRAVALRERSLLVTCAALAARMRLTGNPLLDGIVSSERDREALVSWLPLYHDMGLLTAVLLPVFLGAASYMLDTVTFLLRPAVWLQTIHRVRASFSAAPNFGYAHSARKIRDVDLAGLDLSTWRSAGMGAEPIMPETCAAFVDRFSRHGLSPGAMCPGYGLAENTMTVTAKAPGSPITIRDISADTGGRLVGCGRAVMGTELRVVDDAGQLVHDGVVGNIEVRGASLMAGYVRDGGRMVGADPSGWLSTGDTGLLDGAELFVAGRTKDILIRGGRNVYPQEIESVAARVAGVDLTRVAAFGIADVALGSERIVVYVEERPREGELTAQIVEDVRAAIFDEVGVVADEVRTVGPRTIPRTTSGKLMRVRCREEYEALRSVSGSKPQ